MKIRSKCSLKMKKGEQFHLDNLYSLMQGNGDLFSQHGIDIHGEEFDDSDDCKAEKDFEIIVTVKTKDGK